MEPGRRPRKRTDEVHDALAAGERSRGGPDGSAMLVTMTRADLRGLVADAVADALAEVQPAQPAPALVDRQGLAQALSVSLSTVDRLQREGAPLVRVGDSPRFRVSELVAWLTARGPTHSIAGGKK